MEEQRQDQPIVEVSSDVSRKAYRSFYWRWMSCHRKGYLVAIAIMSLFLAAMLCLLFVKPEPEMSYLSIMLIPAGWQLWYCFSEHRAVYRTTTTYAFYEAHVVLRRQIKGVLQSNVVTYDRCAAFETKTAFCVYPLTQKVSAYIRGWEYYTPDPYGVSVILDKRCLAPEQQQALRALFARKFGDKYKERK